MQNDAAPFGACSELPTEDGSSTYSTTLMSTTCSSFRLIFMRLLIADMLKLFNPNRVGLSKNKTDAAVCRPLSTMLIVRKRTKN
jgi:hypothetical protein